jgi:alpha-mannosidase
MSEGPPPSDLARIRGRYPSYTRERLADFSRRLGRRVHSDRTPVECIEMAGPTGRIGFDEARDLPFRPAAIGEALGPLWATYWFRVTVRVPDEWAGARADLHWDSRSEALLWLDGRSSRGLNIGRTSAPLIAEAQGGERITFHIEVACNRAFGVAEGGSAGGDAREPYRLAACEARRFDAEAWSLSCDFEVLRQLEADRAPPQVAHSFGGVGGAIVRPALDARWAGKLLHELNRVCNCLDPDDRATWPAGRAILAQLLKVRNGDVTHELSCVGHAHIDTAWLWPIEETRRKCQRTFATVIALMDEHPHLMFACSQAYQYAAIEESDPELFARILAKARTGQWIPVGGSWVEPDCNLPSGESLCRQFLYGQRYFERTFGARSTIFWNPDVFGYAGQLPQMMREAGMSRFLTQKLSWNRFTAPPHHSFRWRGLDGSEVLTHFPPADTYNGMATVGELRYHAANYKDSDRSDDGLYLFGYGDGGGGPTEAMAETLARVGDLLGVPRTTMRGPDAFFDRLAASAADLAVIEGELYFEYHRGVYTTQAEIKRLNRLIEGRLQDLEFLSAATTLAGLDGIAGRAEVERLWRTLLTNQFHDVLPGSSIREVYERALPELEALAAEAASTNERLMESLSAPASNVSQARPVNTIGFARAEVAAGPDGALAYVTAPPFAAGRIGEPAQAVRISQDPRGEVRLENGRLAATFAAGGSLRSLLHIGAGREALAGDGNRILLLDDRPTQYEAWDIDPFALETARDAAEAHAVEITRSGPLRCEVRFERRLGKASTMVQWVRLDADSDFLEIDTRIDWRDRRVLVKAVFPLACRAPYASFEVPFGAVERPTHANTDADLARYESSAHRWIDLSEPGFGVSLLSDARYGFSVFENLMAMSLVRGSLSPDPRADLGEHRFRYALYPHEGDWRSAGTVALGAAFNRPLLWARGEVAPLLDAPLVRAAPANVVVDTIKPAEDGVGLVVRLYESHGARAKARLEFGLAVDNIWLSNTLEDRLSPIPVEGGACVLELRGFQIMTLRLG